ncbi:MAG: hypothetical protein ACYS9X_32815 [Planctomycetota bacterium]
MDSGNEVLFGRIAVYNGLLSMRDLDEILGLRRERAPSKHLGQVLMERELVDQVQARAILAVQRRRLHRGRHPERAKQELDLAEMLVRESAVEPEDVLRARNAQEEMQERGLFPSLADILVQQGDITLRGLAEFQSRIGRKNLRCPCSPGPCPSTGTRSGMCSCGSATSPPNRSRTSSRKTCARGRPR